MTNQLQADQQRYTKHEKREKFNTCGTTWAKFSRDFCLIPVELQLCRAIKNAVLQRTRSVSSHGSVIERDGYSPCRKNSWPKFTSEEPRNFRLTIRFERPDWESMNERGREEIERERERKHASFIGGSFMSRLPAALLRAIDK